MTNVAIEAAPAEVERFFEALFERAFPPRVQVALERVGAIRGRAWRLDVRVRGAPIPLDVTAANERCIARSRHLGYSYSGAELPAPLHRAAATLCRRLAWADRGSDVPAALRVGVGLLTPAAEQPRGTSIWLPGPCDRGCLFCADSFDRVLTPETYTDRRRERALEIVQDPPRLDRERERVRAQIRLVAEAGAARTIDWSGADCLASPLFEESLELAHALGVRKMRLQTPGTKLRDPAFVDYLVAHDVVGISLTAHGHDEATFDFVGGKEGAWRAFWEGLRNALDAGIEVGVSIPLIEHNREGLPALLARLVEEPVAISVFCYHEDADEVRYFRHMAVPLPEASRALEAAVEVTPPRRVSVTGFPPCTLGRAVRAHFGWDYEREGGHHSPRPFRALPVCDGCPHAARCPGAPVQYLDAFGAWEENLLLSEPA